MMTRHDALAPDSTCHPEVWALLPWAVNGTLESNERRVIEERLATCPSCRAELARCHVVAAAVLAAPARTWSPSPADVSRILARASAADDSEPPLTAWWGRRRDEIRRVLAALTPTPPILRWAFAVQGALVVLLVSLVVWQATPPAPVYRTLAKSGEHAGEAHLQIDVAFAEDMTERELRTLLTSVGGTLVGGPSALGIYTIRIEPSSATPAVALETLRAHGKVRLAEPSPDR
jgi:anti-sigma factor RsiW